MPRKKKTNTALWGGRFSQAAHAAVQQFTQSVSFDQRLAHHDIRGSLAHASMLHKAGILSAGELKAIHQGMAAIGKQIESGKFQWDERLEDVHMNIEAALTRNAKAGAKLHTGRSRNDQIATDMRLWLRDQIASDTDAVRSLQASLVQLSCDHPDCILPGYTHLQRAQPVYLAHHLLAYVCMLDRDLGRLADTLKRSDVSPLGSGALAGSTLPLDRQHTARELDFSYLTPNSMDAVGDRDFVLEYCSTCAIIAIHLSRLAEDLILWSTAEFGFIRIGDAFTTGSSLMPQKKNPDIAELVRGKSGRVVGNLVSLLVMLKGLPMTYNRDLQEDKERLFDTADTINASLRIMALMLRDVEVFEKRCEATAADPLLLATDVADVLVASGVPFRHAHEIVGKAVAYCEKRRQSISELSLREWKNIDSRVTDEALRVFHPRGALQRRNMMGAPSKANITRQLTRWRKVLKSWL